MVRLRGYEKYLQQTREGTRDFDKREGQLVRLSKNGKTLKSPMYILALESSCDETAASVVSCDTGKHTNGIRKNILIRSNIVATQIEVHRKTGGVVPEVAAREHVGKMLPVVEKALAKAGVKITEIDCFAATAGPGLITALMVAAETAKVLSLTHKKPLIPINHVEAHIAVNMIHGAEIHFPALALVVSGGHTELILMPRAGVYQLIGRTRDDAAGEAFDKIAALLKLSYPGGPAIARAAQKGKADALTLPRPMKDKKGYEFSFSGLKTAVFYATKEKKITSRLQADVAREAQDAIVDVLVHKTGKAIDEFHIKTLFLAGGVAANTLLREKLTKLSAQKNIPFFKPDMHFCTDNAAMIGVAATQYIDKKQAKAQDVRVNPQWELVEG